MKNSESQQYLHIQFLQFTEARQMDAVGFPRRYPLGLNWNLAIIESIVNMKSRLNWTNQNS